MSSTTSHNPHGPPANGRWFRVLQARAAGAAQSVTQRVQDHKLIDLSGILTVLLVILEVSSAHQLREVILIASAAGILERRLLSQPWYWFGLTALLFVNHLLHWESHDNHQYLLTYWCLAMGASRLVPDSLRALAMNARLLIGLCFLFATVWKLTSTEFVDGTFFHFTLLTDRRFSGFADLVGGVPGEVTFANSSALRRLLRPYGDVDVIQLRDAPRIAELARFLSLWTVGIEGLIALVFLVPVGFRLARGRDAVLLLFMLSTYPVATVVGFGRLLSVMAMVQSRNRFGVERPLYLALFLLMPLFRFPFGRVLRLLLG